MLTLPNLLTLLNLFFGCIALYGIYYESVTIVIVAFGLSLVFDFLDGLAARKLNQTSEIGKDLDSLADLVSFGIFPTFLIVESIERQIEIIENPVYLLIFVLGCGTALRLAKFNTTPQTKGIFQGLPSPAMGFFVFSLWINIDNESIPLFDVLHSPPFYFIISILLAVLMNINIPFLKLSVNRDRNISTIFSILLILVFLFLVLVDWKLAFILSCILYMVLSILLPIFRKG